MAKTTVTFESATAAAEAAKTKRQAARKVLDAFMEKNGLKAKKNHADDAKHGKEWKKLHDIWSAAKEAQEAAEKEAKSLKPVTERAVKYDYPADVVTADDKKKHRAKMRALALKEAKGESTDAKPAKAAKEEKSSKGEKSSKKAAAEPAKEAAPAATEPAKKKKKKVVAED
jgi:hypothetical protein